MKRRKKDNNDDDDNGFAAWGGYMEAKKSKLLEQFSDAVNNEENRQSNIFNGISIFVNGYTKPSASELKQIMSMHGGIYHHYHNPSRTKFIIASNLPDTKIKQLGPNQKIVKPEWITDSVKEEKLLDYTDYLLYTNHNRRQPRLNFEKVSIVDLSESKKNRNCTNITNPPSPDLFDSEENKFETIDHIDQSENIILADNVNISKTETTISKDKSTRTLTANDPKFLSEFYNNSRLHHISTLGATFKQHVFNLRQESKFLFPKRQHFQRYLSDLKIRSPPDNLSKSIIMHIDMDCFFVSVGLRKRPELRGVPVAVTHSKGGQEPSARSGVDRQAELDCYKQRIQERLKSEKISELGPGNMLLRLEGIENQSMSEIASCSYEVRKAGVKNGMFMGTALKLCPNLQTIPYDFEGYKEVAFSLYNTITEYTLNIEAVSCDEMFVDVTELLKQTNASVDEWANYIRTLIKNRTGCPCSTGFGMNRLQARLATRTAKPDGQFHLIPEAVEEYMIDIKVDDLPGVGRSTSLKLESLGIKTCGQLQSMSVARLKLQFGVRTGEILFQHCYGIDNKPLVYEHERKSVSAEINYGIRFTTDEEAETFLKQLAGEVHSRLKEIQMKGKSITLKLMIRSKDAPLESSKYMGHGICDYVNKSTTLSTATCDLDIITREVLLIAKKLAVPAQELRGIGIQISRLLKEKNAAKSSVLTKFLNATSRKDSNTNINESSNQYDNKNNSTISNTITRNTSTVNKNNDTLNKSYTSKVNATKTKTENSSPKNLSVNQQKEEMSNLISINEENVSEKNESRKISNNVNKTQSKSGRGRPRGKNNGTRNLTRKKSDNNIGSLEQFLAPQNNQEMIQFNEIDMDVLAALPEDIKNEILAQYQLPEQNNNQNQLKTTNNLKTNVQLTEIKNKQDELKITEKISDDKNDKKLENNSTKIEDCMFSRMNTKQLKNLVQDWVSSDNTPELCDIKMLGNYFKQLALDKKINDLFVMLKFIYSEILFKNNCTWHRAYFDIMNTAQEGMIAKYGSSIWANKDFQCENDCHLLKR